LHAPLGVPTRFTLRESESESGPLLLLVGYFAWPRRKSDQPRSATGKKLEAISKIPSPHLSGAREYF